MSLYRSCDFPEYAEAEAEATRRFLVLMWITVCLIAAACGVFVMFATGRWTLPANWPDIVNGLFELCGAPFILLSVVRLYKDKQVRGVSWAHAGFFMAWGYWNLYFYPHLGQWLSFWGGMAIVIVNTIWMGQLVYYSVINRSALHYPEGYTGDLEGNFWSQSDIAEQIRLHNLRYTRN